MNWQKAGLAVVTLLIAGGLTFGLSTAGAGRETLGVALSTLAVAAGFAWFALPEDEEEWYPWRGCAVLVLVVVGLLVFLFILADINENSGRN